MKRNIKIFLASAIPCSIFMGILYSVLYGPHAGMISGLAAGLIFGFLMFIILGFLHSRAVKRLAGEATAESMETFHFRNMTLSLPYDGTFDLCMQSLLLLGRHRVHEENRSLGKIVVKSSINWKTWGDTISFDIDGRSSEITNVQVSSRPTSWTTLVDYGKNLKNVEKIVSYLENSAGAGVGIRAVM
jgi:hypothetical protein